MFLDRKKDRVLINVCLDAIICPESQELSPKLSPVYLQLSVAAGQAAEGLSEPLLRVQQGGDGVIHKVLLGEATDRVVLVTHNLDVIAQDLSAEDFEHSCHKSEWMIKFDFLSLTF